MEWRETGHEPLSFFATYVAFVPLLFPLVPSSSLSLLSPAELSMHGLGHNPVQQAKALCCCPGDKDEGMRTHGRVLVGCNLREGRLDEAQEVRAGGDVVGDRLEEG